LVSFSVRHLQSDEALLDALLGLNGTTLDATVVPLDAVSKSRLHLLKFVEDEVEVGIDGQLVHPHPTSVVVRIGLHEP
jgi:hypothetical protein